jgi:23S rRNA (cytidine1920-2'-O)/16S rRNA (cytidine1409-2'-O)-methyltransferase
LPRVRLDLLLTEQGLAESRQKAQALILAGQVLVDGSPGLKPGQQVAADARLTLKAVEPYVSRGGYKLAAALDRFGIDVGGLVVLDGGASTGGFTDVLLQRGASRVYAVDVGRGQLHARLRADPRVAVLDRTNLRYLEALPERPDLAVLDLSFISLRLVVPAVRRLLAPGSSMIALVKPQFEAGRSEVGRGGVVRSPAVHRKVLGGLSAWLAAESLEIRALVPSPIRGPAGNVEFLALIAPLGSPPGPVEQLIDEALQQVERPNVPERSSS